MTWDSINDALVFASGGPLLAGLLWLHNYFTARRSRRAFSYPGVTRDER